MHHLSLGKGQVLFGLQRGGSCPAHSESHRRQCDSSHGRLCRTDAQVCPVLEKVVYANNSTFVQQLVLNLSFRYSIIMLAYTVNSIDNKAVLFCIIYKLSRVFINCYGNSGKWEYYLLLDKVYVCVIFQTLQEIITKFYCISCAKSLMMMLYIITRESII